MVFPLRCLLLFHLEGSFTARWLHASLCVKLQLNSSPLVYGVRSAKLSPVVLNAQLSSISMLVAAKPIEIGHKTKNATPFKLTSNSYVVVQINNVHTYTYKHAQSATQIANRLLHTHFVKTGFAGVEELFRSTKMILECPSSCIIDLHSGDLFIFHFWR